VWTSHARKGKRGEVVSAASVALSVVLALDLSLFFIAAAIFSLAVPYERLV